MPEQSRHDGADLAGADHGSRLARHVESDQSVEREVAVAHAVVGAMDLAVQAEHQRQRVFGDGVRRVRRHPHHRDTETGGRVEIDVVEPGTPQRHTGRPGCGQHLEHVGGEVVVDERADHVDSARVADGRWVEPGLVVLDVHSSITPHRTVGIVERPPVVWLGRVHRHRRHGPILAAVMRRCNRRSGVSARLVVRRVPALRGSPCATRPRGSHARSEEGP